MILYFGNINDGTERHITVYNVREFKLQNKSMLGWWRDNNHLGFCVSMEYLKRRYTHVVAWPADDYSADLIWLHRPEHISQLK